MQERLETTALSTPRLAGLEAALTRLGYEVTDFGNVEAPVAEA